MTRDPMLIVRANQLGNLLCLIGHYLPHTGSASMDAMCSITKT
jgi:hypothetical protein